MLRKTLKGIVYIKQQYLLCLRTFSIVRIYFLTEIGWKIQMIICQQKRHLENGYIDLLCCKGRLQSYRYICQNGGSIASTEHIDQNTSRRIVTIVFYKRGSKRGKSVLVKFSSHLLHLRVRRKEICVCIPSIKCRG